MPLDHTHLKVDQTLLHYGGRFLLITNINIPADYLTDQHLAGVLARTRRLILHDYRGINHQDIHYQVCASYDLRNSETGELRHWSGSFNPKGNRLNILCDFQTFVEDTFETEVARACHPNNVYNKLRFFHTQTTWVFDSLSSAIVCVQARISPNHPTVENKGLLDTRNGHHRRVHITSLLG